MLYFDQFTDFERYFDSKWLLHAKITFRRKIYKIFYYPIKTLYVIFLSFFSFFKDWFCCVMVKQRKFLHDVDLPFDARFLKYRFSLHYHKQCPINSIQVKCAQICQNVCDIFWMCFDKLRELLISSFWSGDFDFW